MKQNALIVAAILWSTMMIAQADQSIESAQQILKDQGFYYGEINGQKDTDTVAAVRRYQIRNGLSVTGELDPATQQSLGMNATASTRPAAKPATTPEANTSDSREQSSNPQTTTRVNPMQPRNYDAQPSRGPQDYPFAPNPSRSAPDYPNAGSTVPPTSGDLFVNTPYQGAPPGEQRQVIVGAQVILMRGGYYRSGIDGIYGPGMEFSLRAYQSRVGLPVSGRLDMETLGALRLLPGQRAMEFGPPRRVWSGRPIEPPVRGEWIH
jgi:peptidoglycan hydrolase-like protein with peptidoglycan-binding domain